MWFDFEKMIEFILQKKIKFAADSQTTKLFAFKFLIKYYF